MKMKYLQMAVADLGGLFSALKRASAQILFMARGQTTVHPKRSDGLRRKL